MSEELSIHVSVLPDEVMQLLEPSAGQVFVDGTLGGGGHCRRLAEAVGVSGRIIALDRDPAAITRATGWAEGSPVTLAQANFADLPEVLDRLAIGRIDGVLLDLGLSSDQLADRQRGFSFDADGPLDLRFDPTSGEPAYRLVNQLREENLANLIYAYGEERYSRRIARAVVERRRQRPIETARELAEIVRRCVPSGRGRPRIDPATRTFQALRIAVNHELDSLETALRRIPDRLKPGGRLAIISFHSLEDRRVKLAFRQDERLDNMTRKPITASDAEAAANPRSRSAKLRVARRKVS